MNTIVLHNNSKFNKNDYAGFCVICLENRLFRHVLLNGKNCIICTGCLAAKTIGKEKLGLMYKDRLTFADKLVRIKIRLAAFFTGRYNRSRFDIRILRGK